MPQTGFLDCSDGCASPDAKKDPSGGITAVVPWKAFRPVPERVRRKAEGGRKSRAGRKPMDAVGMVRTPVLSVLCKLPDDRTGYQLRGRLSFMRVPGLGPGAPVPDAKTVRLCRGGLAQGGSGGGAVQAIGRPSGASGPDCAGRADHGCRAGMRPWFKHAREGSCRCRATTTDAGKTLRSRRKRRRRAGPTNLPSDRRRMVTRAGPRKHGTSQCGCKTHGNVARGHKPVRRCPVTGAAGHDSQAVDHLLMQGNAGLGAWADAACRCEKTQAKLHAQKLRSRIHRTGKRSKLLTEQAKGSNRAGSPVRAGVGQVFGAQTNDMGGTLARMIGMMRARAEIGMKTWPATCAVPPPCPLSGLTAGQENQAARPKNATRDRPGTEGRRANNTAPSQHPSHPGSRAGPPASGKGENRGGPP
jgi:IS5 family transposase